MMGLEPIQPPEEIVFPPVPEDLGAMIEVALRSNPDLARLEAELHAARMKVTQEITEVHNALKKLRAQAARARDQLKSALAAAEKGVVPARVSRANAEQALVLAESELGELMARARYLVGAGMPGSMSAMEPFPSPPPGVPTPRPTHEDDKRPIQQILDTSVSIDFEDEQLVDILDFLADFVGVNISPDAAAGHIIVYDITTRNVPVRDALLALTDLCEPLCFVVRDYGILATTRARAQTIPGPSIPEDIPFFAPEEPPVRTSEMTESTSPFFAPEEPAGSAAPPPLSAE